jgi:hypothetical protein
MNLNPIGHLFIGKSLNDWLALSFFRGGFMSIFNMGINYGERRYVMEENGWAILIRTPRIYIFRNPQSN